MDWFSKSVKTCPTVIGKMVQWNIHCYECDAIIHKESDFWGGMCESKKYEVIICFKCWASHILKLNEELQSIEQYEI